jgi:signal transduction histidine kinase
MAFVDYQKFPILYVDDESANLVTLSYLLDGKFTLVTTTSPTEALEMLAHQDIAVLLTDHRMPEMDGVELCVRAAALRPEVARVIITAYADVHATMDAVNRGHVLRYLAKPWRNEDLIEALTTTIDFVAMQRTIKDLELRMLRTAPSSGAAVIRSGLAHEVAQPLHALRLNLQLICDLLKDLAQESSANRIVGELMESTMDSIAAAEQISGIVARFRQGVPRGPSPSPWFCSVERIVEATVRIVRAEVGRVAALSVSIAAAPRVLMDPTHLSQVLINLVINAAQAFSLPLRGDEQVRIAVSQQDRVAVIQVADNGPGISDDDRDRIFDPYFTTKQAGTGLGLAVVRDLLVRAGGSIDFETGASGTTFTVRVPLTPEST